MVETDSSVRSYKTGGGGTFYTCEKGGGAILEIWEKYQ